MNREVLVDASLNGTDISVMPSQSEDGVITALNCYSLILFL